MPGYKVGIDLGGTKVFAVAVNEKMEIIGRSKLRTDVGGGFEAVSLQMKEVAEKALIEGGGSLADVKTIGAAIPAAVDPESGDALHAPNLGWKNLSVRNGLEKVFGKPVVLDNDVNCGTLGEYKAGAAKGAQSVVGFFVGTGLGGGLILDGKLWRGKRGVAGELGHTIIRKNGRTCGCGGKGCLEAYCSKTAFCKQFDKLINKRGAYSMLCDIHGKDFDSIKSKALRKSWQKGDAVVHNVLSKGMKALGIVCANVVATLSPECIVLGGGVMEALGEELLPHVEKSFAKHLFAVNPDDVALKLSTLGDDAVALGAAMLV